MDDWRQLLYAVDAAHSAALHDWLFERGLHDCAFASEGGRSVLHCFYRRDAEAEAWRRALAEWGLQPMSDQGAHVPEYNRLAQPRHLAAAWYAVPPGQAAPPQAHGHVILQPGSAFGFGDHVATTLAAGLLLDLDCRGRQVVDCGCGTGILGLLAARRGARHVIGIDNDPTAIDLAHTNAHHNGLDDLCDWHCGALLEPVANETGIDLLIANLYADLLIDLFADPRLATIVGPDARIILSGIHADKRAALVAALPDQMHIEAWRQADDWHALSGVWCGSSQA